MHCCFFLLFLCAATNLLGLQSAPWLGNWLEFEGIIDQEHTQSRTIDTANGTKHKFLHQEKTIASLEFMPFVDLSAEIELDLTKTQKRSYGFDAIKGSSRYRLLNDLTGDPVSLTVGLSAALSTPKRVKDLSSSQHGVFETEASVAIGREFNLHEDSYTKLLALATSGLASSGSPWVGAEVHLGQVVHAAHRFDLFFALKRAFHRINSLVYQIFIAGLALATNLKNSALAIH